jgi:glycosyltransferase involved in cell wall biosynthesis
MPGADGSRIGSDTFGKTPVRLKLPLVSIIITNFNYSEYIAAAIASVRDQSYPRFECVVIDDRSTDTSWDVIEKCLSDMADARFRAIRLDRNSGQLGAMRAGLESISGEFVTFLDADDFLFPSFVATHVAVHLNDRHSAGITASDTVQVNQEGAATEGTYFSLKKERFDNEWEEVKTIGRPAIPQTAGDCLLADLGETTVSYVDRSVMGWHGVATSGFMFRRDALCLVMPSETEKYRICADYFLATFIHALTGTLTISKALGAYRLHGRNGWGRNPHLGGPNPFGHFRREDEAKTRLEIARTICSNIEKFSNIVGLDACEAIIRACCEPHEVFEQVRASPLLRRQFGWGTQWRFYVYYGLQARLKRWLKSW